MRLRLNVRSNSKVHTAEKQPKGLSFASKTKIQTTLLPSGPFHNLATYPVPAFFLRRRHARRVSDCSQGMPYCYDRSQSIQVFCQIKKILYVKIVSIIMLSVSSDNNSPPALSIFAIHECRILKIVLICGNRSQSGIVKLTLSRLYIFWSGVPMFFSALFYLIRIPRFFIISSIYI